MSDPTPHLTSLKRDGYVLIPNLLSPAQLESLRNAASHITHLARNGKWPHIRTVPKQFPPWPNTPPPASEGGIWGVQHLLHPEMPGRAEFAKLYFSPEVLNIVEELLGLPPSSSYSSTADQPSTETSTPSGSFSSPSRSPPPAEPLTMELFNLLVSPTHKSFALRWHRDDIPTPATLSAEEELTLLQAKSPPNKPQSHAQYNIALYEDASLIVVPGSHRRARTDVERAADPYENDIPGQVRVKMAAGDAVFYDSNIFHRGVYEGVQSVGSAGEEGNVDGCRMTVHGSVGLAEPHEQQDDKESERRREGDKKKGTKTNQRAKVVLQHGVGFWVDREDAGFEGLGVSSRAERMRKRLVEMGRGEDVGYSLEG